MKEITGIVLSAGFGTRLRPFTEDLPKPLVPLLDKTPIWHQIMILKKYGVKKIYVNLHYFPEMIDNYIERNFKDISTIYEPKILGTGGGISNIVRKFNIDTPIIVLNGDTVSNVDLEKMVDFHLEKGSDATMLLKKNRNILDENSVFVDKQNRIIAVKRRPSETDSAYFKCSFLGIHILNPALFDYLPNEGCINKLAYPMFIENNFKIYGFITRRDSFDIGTIENLYFSNMGFLGSEITSPVFTKRYIAQRRDNNNNIIGENVFLSDSTIRNSIICSNCKIIGSVIEDSIIFSDTNIENVHIKRGLANSKYRYII